MCNLHRQRTFIIVKMFRIIVLCVFINICACRTDMYEGDLCTKDGAYGICIDAGRCTRAIDDIKRKIMPQLCSFKDTTPIVCCVNHTTAVSTIPLKTTTEATLPQSEDGCKPIHLNITAAKTGRKAWDKCIEYQELVFPCGVDPLDGSVQRLNQCNQAIGMLIIRGTEVYEHEFPHMVRLGTTAEDGKMEWIGSCAGALISDRFVLTTAHCTIARGKAVTYVRLDSKVTHTVKGVIRHPEYRPPKSANDIALLEMEKPVLLDQFTVPACLPVVDDEVKRAIATGWDITVSKNPEGLQMSITRQAPASECTAALPPRGVKLTEGGHYNCFQDSTNYTCLGSKILQVKNNHIYCMYDVVGVGLFAAGCPGLGAYTTVAHYVPWIEDIVWK